jgi:putative sigma-54 modulation protein
MKIIIKTKNVDLTDALQSFIEEKIGSIKKFIDVLKEDTPQKGKTLAEVFVEVEKETEHHKKGKVFGVKAQIVLPGKILTVGAREDDMFKAVVKAKDELKMEVEKYKVKHMETGRRERRKSKGEIEI